MTAIAYKNGRMAADTLCTMSNRKFHAVKIAKHDGHLLGAAGDLPSIVDLVRWYFLAPGKPTRPKFEGFDFDMMVVTPSGRIHVWDNRGTFEPISHKFWAVGSGGLACLGAMEHGASADQAVRAAIKWADGCGGRVTVRTLK